MPKSGDAAIPMKTNLDNVDFLVGETFEEVDSLINKAPYSVYADVVLDFFSDVSSYIFQDPQVKHYPDVATFAFYCRRSNLNKTKREFSKDSFINVGRGVVFHITPSNVPVNFAYSLLAGMITGNVNIVRVPSKTFPQVQIIVNALVYVLNQSKYQAQLASRVYLVRYSRDNLATEFFSSFCDVRIIWGGDRTIEEIRQAPIPAKSTEITFSDRYSIAVIRASEYLHSANKLKLAEDFYNDTYLFDQNACTSPQALFWVGDNSSVEKAKNQFWKMLDQIISDKKYEIQHITAVDKLTTYYAQAISKFDVQLNVSGNNTVWRVNNKSNANREEIQSYRCVGGYFNEFTLSSLNEIHTVLNRKLQTVGYYGFTRFELEQWIVESTPLGLDRVVPIGRTMDFSFQWDGHDMINSLSRVITIN